MQVAKGGDSIVLQRARAFGKLCSTKYPNIVSMIRKHESHDLESVFDDITSIGYKKRELEILRKNLEIVTSTENSFGLGITTKLWQDYEFRSQ